MKISTRNIDSFRVAKLRGLSAFTKNLTTNETSYKEKVKEWLRGNMNESTSKRPSIEKSATHGDLKERVLVYDKIHD